MRSRSGIKTVARNKRRSMREQRILKPPMSTRPTDNAHGAPAAGRTPRTAGCAARWMVRYSNLRTARFNLPSVDLLEAGRDHFPIRVGLHHPSAPPRRKLPIFQSTHQIIRPWQAPVVTHPECPAAIHPYLQGTRMAHRATATGGRNPQAATQGQQARTLPPEHHQRRMCQGTPTANPSRQTRPVLPIHPPTQKGHTTRCPLPWCSLLRQQRRHLPRLRSSPSRSGLK